MRDYVTTIENLICLIPEDETYAINQMKKLISPDHLPYRAPETLWAFLNEAVWSFISSNPSKWSNWQKYFISVYSTRGISSIESSINES